VMYPFNRARRGGPSYEIGVSIGHVSWSLGVGMRILDEIKELAIRKRREGRASLIDQPTFQRDFARATASLEAARAYVRSVYTDWLEAAVQGDVGLEVRARGRLAACWATEIAASVGQFAYLAAGSDGLRNEGGDNRLQRCFRDLFAGSTHRHVDGNVLLDCSTVLLGINDQEVVL
jgi:alkylation response protein AidB-like acyl-CoA dehydrogenase